VVGVGESSAKLIKGIIEANPTAVATNWINADLDKMKASIINAPSREDLDQTIKEALIVEYYSRK